MAQIVVLDGTAIPTPEHWRVWMRALGDHGFAAVRTGALAPRQAAQVERAGLRLVQELALLDAVAPFVIAPTAHRTHRLRVDDLALAAEIDRSAFGDTWALDATMLADIRQATPTHRARVVRVGGRPTGFLITGRAARVGYVQRLAVHPASHRQGVATSLLVDGLRWMRRSRVRRAFVNTHVENEAALELYRRHGFTELPERLRVYEGAIVA
ncbi:MAG: GNAT family N-acetyltransferase [Ilumatobacteraceae bacterium]|nr:GNAT family N-acetyltransferase [Acidimicrobiales bacterium]MCB9392966.1 GNAT family N-acetyltransferase [Acidimicrobiaceae bacterium]